MDLTPEQKKTVAAWVAAGDNLSRIQRRLADELKVSLTYKDVRFLVDDLNLELKDPPPKASTDLAAPAARAPQAAAPGALPPGTAPADGDGLEEGAEDFGPEPAPGPPGAAKVTVVVDKVTLIPGAIASGTVTFGDGVTGKWIVDNYGRPGFTEVSRPDYRPSPADAQAFMQELSTALHKRGL